MGQFLVIAVEKVYSCERDLEHLVQIVVKCLSTVTHLLCISLITCKPCFCSGIFNKQSKYAHYYVKYKLEITLLYQCDGLKNYSL